MLKFAGLFLPIFIFAAIPSTDAAAMSQTQAQNRILLDCPADLPGSEPVCDALEQSLRAASPDHVLVRDASGRTPPLQAGDLSVILRVSTVSARSIAGHLETREGSESDWTNGPELRSDVMDTEFSPALIRAFTDELVRTSVIFE